MKKIHRKILMVEDDEFLTDIYRQKFLNAGLEVKIINRPNEKFLDEVVSYNPDIISMGLMLPDYYGWDLTKILKNDPMTKDIRIIGFDNLSQAEDKEKALNSGMDDYILMSSVTPDKYVATIKTYLDTEFKIERVIEKFADGDYRFSNSGFQMSTSWFPFFPDFSDNIMSDYGISGADNSVNPKLHKEIEAEFLEEINTISEMIKSVKPTEKEDSKKSVIMDSLNIRAKALAIWDYYAIPIRIRGNSVYRIWTPADVIGTPVIKMLPIKYFISLVAEKMVKDGAELTKLKTNTEIMKTAIVVLIIILLLIIFL